MRHVRKDRDTGDLVVVYEVRCLRCRRTHRAIFLVSQFLDATEGWDLAIQRAFMDGSRYAFRDAPHDGFCPACLKELAFKVDHFDGVGILEWFRGVTS